MSPARSSPLSLVRLPYKGDRTIFSHISEQFRNIYMRSWHTPSMRTENRATRIGAALIPPLDDAVEQLRGLGYSDSEIIRRGVRLLAAEEGIAIRSP